MKGKIKYYCAYRCIGGYASGICRWLWEQKSVAYCMSKDYCYHKVDAKELKRRLNNVKG